VRFAEIASQWNSVQRQDFIQGSAINVCQRVQAVNAGNLIFAFDAVKTARSNLKSGLPMLFRKRHTCCVNLTHRPSELLTDRPQFCTGICLPLPLGKEVSAELSDLSTQQTKALTDAIFVGMTAEQWSEYDNRHARILEILRGGQVSGLKVP
jgi:hypothetical protein